METTYPKIFHIIIPIIEKFIDISGALLDEKVRRVYITGSLNCLLKNTFTKMKSLFNIFLLDDRLVQNRISFSST